MSKDSAEGLLRELDELESSAKLLGAIDAKRGFDCYTEADARLELAIRQSISRRRARISAFLATPQTGEGDVQRYLNAFAHTHVNNGVSGDSCKQCGLDLRDPIHLRYGDTRGTYQPLPPADEKGE